MRPISKRAARIARLGVALVTVAGALLWFLLSDAGSQGPPIKGKPLAFWTRQLRAGQMDPDVISALASEKVAAIPALVTQLSLPDAAARDFAKRLWLRLPAALQDLIPEPTTRADLRAGAAFALVVIYDNEFLETVPTSPSEAQMMLPALTKALQDQDMFVRLNAAVALGNLGPVSAQAIESCDVALKDPNWMVRANAVYALGRLARSDEQAIPRLKSALADSHPKVSQRVEEELELLGVASPRDGASIATEAKP